MLPQKTKTYVVYNACYGGFSLSRAAVERIMELKGLPCYPKKVFLSSYIYYMAPWKGVKGTAERELPVFCDRDISRHDPHLIQVVQEMGEAANGLCAKLELYEVDVGTLYRIDEYDGYEAVVCQYDDVWRVAE